MIRVLVVDDSALMRKVLGDVLSAACDMEVGFARNGIEAIAQIHAFRPDVVTLDLHMPGMDGLACLDRILLERPCPVVMVAALTEAGADVTLEAMQRGAVDFIPKPAGTISLAVAAFGPLLLLRVRAAARARVRRSFRLAERVRLRARGAGGAGLPPAMAAAPRPPARAGAGAGAGTSAAGTALSARLPPHCAVLVGTSTGGPPALDALLSPLPAEFPWPILVAQHMPASFTGPLSRRLDRLCALRVIEVTEPMRLEAGTVYIGRGDADLLVGHRPGGPIALPAPAAPEHRWHPSVDRLVTSAMAQFAPARLIGVLMTGMGSDGAEAMTRLHAGGGRTIAEAEETAVVWGMPGELVRAGGADLVLPLDSIARHLLDWVP